MRDSRKHKRFYLVSSLVCTMLVAGLTGCGATDKTPQPRQTNQVKEAPPKITRVRDVGATMPGANQKSAKPDSDGLIYPGELLLIEGRFTPDTRASIDNIAIDLLPVKAGVVGARVPSGLSIATKHTLRLENPLGHADWQFYSRHYLAATDTDANRLQFLRTEPLAKGLIDNDSVKGATHEMTRPMFSAFSGSRTYLYAFGIDSRGKADTDTGSGYRVRMDILDMVSASEPKAIVSEQIEMNSQLSAIAREGSRLMLLGTRELLILDISNELAPRVLGRITLPSEQGDELYLDGEFIDGGKRLVLLEARHNGLLSVDVSAPELPVVSGRLQLFDGINLPLLVDLVSRAGADDDAGLWLVAGSNLRAMGRQGKALFSELLGEDSDTSETDLPEVLIDIRLSADGQLVAGRRLALPDNFVPFYGVSAADGKLYITGLNGNVLDFDDLSLDSELVGKVFKGMLGTMQFGRVLALDPVSGSISDHARGLGLYYHLQYDEDLGPVFALYKLSGKLFAPFVKAKWGVGVGSRGTFGLRDGSAKSIFPPYSVGHISLQ